MAEKSMAARMRDNDKARSGLYKEQDRIRKELRGLRDELLAMEDEQRQGAPDEGGKSVAAKGATVSARAGK